MNSNSTKLKQIRKFGFIALLFFGSLCILGIWFRKPIPTYFFGFLSICGFGFIIAPKHLRPVYVIWQKVAHFIGHCTTIIILTLAYYVVITPFALVKRKFGGRPLPVMLDPDTSSLL